ncbi:MAG: hypothetical protein JWN05_2546 [Arthrobacter sp.]|jgi:hypothetical protein|nr:hypothetical protein [Arthrobacter sp.]
MKIPEPRGPISAGLLGLLAGPPGAGSKATAKLDRVIRRQLPLAGDVIDDDDIRLTLFCLHELHYGGLEGVDDRWEWSPALIALRQLLEEAFERALRDAAQPATRQVQLPPAEDLDSDGVAALLFELASQDSGPSMSRYVAKKATREQLSEFLVHKSVYQLKEADPHTWAIPRRAWAG